MRQSPQLVGVGQCRAAHRLAETHVVQLRRLHRQAGFDIPQAFPIGQLGKRHGPVLLAATERPHPAVATVSGNNPAEGLPGQEFHQLGEKRFAGVHRRLQGAPRKLAPTSNRGHRLLTGNPQNSWRSEPSVVS
jgi:hypothetical protein